MNNSIDIVVCMGSACFARGNAQNLEFIENYLKENNMEAKIEISGSRCEGKCAEGPNVIVNGLEHNCVDENILKGILEKIKSET